MKKKLVEGFILVAIFAIFIIGLVKVAEVAIPYQEEFEKNVTVFIEGLED